MNSRLHRVNTDPVNHDRFGRKFFDDITIHFVIAHRDRFTAELTKISGEVVHEAIVVVDDEDQVTSLRLPELAK